MHPIIGIILIFLAFWFTTVAVVEARKKWVEHRVKKLISLDRIARLADAGEKDVSFHVIGSRNERWSDHHYKVYQVQFSYSCDESLKDPNRRNPNHFAGDPLPVSAYHSNAATEEAVAQSIIQIKSLYKK